MTPIERLEELGAEAWRQAPKDAAARRAHVAKELSGERTWALIEGWQSAMLVQAVGWLLNRTKPVQSADGGAALVEPHRSIAATDTPAAAIEHAKLRNGVQRPASSRRKRAQMIAAKSAVANELSKLDSIFIGGKPIGDCTVAVVRNWMGRCTHKARIASIHARFAGALIANLPAQAVIRHWWTNPAEVDAIYENAEREYAI